MKKFDLENHEIDRSIGESEIPDQNRTAKQIMNSRERERERKGAKDTCFGTDLELTM